MLFIDDKIMNNFFINKNIKKEKLYIFESNSSGFIYKHVTSKNGLGFLQAFCNRDYYITEGFFISYENMFTPFKYYTTIKCFSLENDNLFAMDEIKEMLQNFDSWYIELEGLRYKLFFSNKNDATLFKLKDYNVKECKKSKIPMLWRRIFGYKGHLKRIRNV